MAHSAKNPADKTKRLDEALTASAWMLDLIPDLRRDLPRSMHPVLADLQESANAVHGYIAKTNPAR